MENIGSDGSISGLERSVVVSRALEVFISTGSLEADPEAMGLESGRTTGSPVPPAICRGSC